MKNFLKKFHIASNQADNVEGSNSSRGNKFSGVSLPDDKAFQPRSHDHNKPFVGVSNWLNSVTKRKSPSPPSSSNVPRGDRMEPSDSVGSRGFDIVSEAAGHESESAASRDPDVEEEYQIQLAMELSAREDPEATQIEAFKQISLGSCDPENTPAEVVAYRYWNYNSLGYDDKILDGFYDLYGIFTESTEDRMPSLIDLQGAQVSDSITWEAVLVNRDSDANLLKLEQRVLEMAVKFRSKSLVSVGSDLVRKIAVLVSDYMGGPVGDPESMLREWQSFSYSLKAALGSMVLPVGSLTFGLSRHRALMFKVLADSVSIPCRLVKCQQYTGTNDVALNYVKFDDGREYIVDLMADPGTLIPSDAAGSNIEYGYSFFCANPRDFDPAHAASSSSGVPSSFEEHSDLLTSENKPRFRSVGAAASSDDRSGFHEHDNLKRPSKSEEGCKMSSEYNTKFSEVEKAVLKELPAKPTYPHAHTRSPSWTEGISSPAVRRMKVKDVSQYMIDAAKENPNLAQKLHDVLLESGVVAPPNLFSEIYRDDLSSSSSEAKSVKDEDKQKTEVQLLNNESNLGAARFLPPLPPPRVHSKTTPDCNETGDLKLLEGDVVSHPFDISSLSEALPVRCVKNVPVAAAAAAAAAVVASSMVAAVAKSSTDTIPVAAAVTAAAVVATTAAVSKQYKQGARGDNDADSSGYEPRGSGAHGSSGQECNSSGENAEAERISDRSTGYDSSKSDVTLEDVADCEIHWEDITLGERIGLGSYGEVYRGEWHGTEVAVKRFLDQAITVDSLEEFKSEVWIMKRLRHPNVVLFMGAVTRAPNLSIVTEFLPRGSLYRLIHRPNNQLDERRRLRMALDCARGMNYLHNCSPVIVHRDLKSPNLLVDKNWVVKVCDFGLSRMKHSTFLSSRSTAGTAEWMAPEVLRNEPSDEKCDVYSFGVILWELCTMQQPWGGMNPMQVVGAVGFQHRRLDVPDDVDPAIADIIMKCWQTNPRLRPTFAEIMAALKPLQKPITNSQVPRPPTFVQSQLPQQHTDDRAGYPGQ